MPKRYYIIIALLVIIAIIGISNYRTLKKILQQPMLTLEPGKTPDGRGSNTRANKPANDVRRNNSR